MPYNPPKYSKESQVKILKTTLRQIEYIIRTENPDIIPARVQILIDHVTARLKNSD